MDAGSRSCWLIALSVSARAARVVPFLGNGLKTKALRTVPQLRHSCSARVQAVQPVNARLAFGDLNRFSQRCVALLKNAIGGVQAK